MGEMRAQERQPCRRQPNDCRHADDGWCGSDECNGDGTRWVTVGQLVASSLWVELLDDDFNIFAAEPVGDGTTEIRSLYTIEEDTNG